MLALRLPPEIEQRLDALARKTGRSKSYYAREAILRQIEDIEDDYLARRRLSRGGARVTLESLERDLKRRQQSNSAPSPTLPRNRGREPAALRRTKRR